MERNDFLLELLTLQQDGSGAISAPSNWTTRTPLLQVETEVDKIVEELHGAVLKNGESNRNARWHFFIGSPGNGKSAAVGKLCTRLLLGNFCEVRTEGGESIEELYDSEIPYAIDVFEGDNKYASVQIVQDASVVRNPFAPDVDPSAELLNTLEKAWKKGRSLIVCTNRGVLEKAHRDKHTDQSVNSKPWFKILKDVVSVDTSICDKLPGTRDFDNGRSVFESVDISYSHLENHSLLQDDGTFERLLQKATNQAEWDCCETCPAKEMCPFKANRDWLVDNDLRSNVLQLLKRAEILSGQVIVFREALALISFILAGCPRDYKDVQHPCDWVHGKVDRSDVFSLAIRRIYMCLFGSYCPYGLEMTTRLRKEQVEAINTLYERLEKDNSGVKTAIGHVIKSHSSSQEGPPSTDVGVTRLLGENGVIASVNPFKEALPTKFFDRWDSDLEDIRLTCKSYNLGAIEEACISIWKELEQELEFTPGHWASKTHWAIRRWSSNYFLHLGVLAEGHSAWGNELDEFANLLKIMNKPDGPSSMDQKREKRALDTSLGLLLGEAGNENAATVQLSDSVTLSGDWVRNALKPKTVPNRKSGSVSLAIEYDGKERAVLGALMYIWLKRRAEGKLDQRCFPLELLIGATDARVRAASKGKYAFANDDVELIIKTDSVDDLKIVRLEGDVGVENG